MGFAPDPESTEPPPPRRKAVAAFVRTEACWVELARDYLNRWGLRDPSTSDAAARRLTELVLAAGTADPSAICREIVRLARQWIEDFARGALGSEAEWFWQAPALLTKYPTLFLETPCPRFAAARPSFRVLPDPSPRPMMQQAIADSLEVLAHALRDASERIGWSRIPDPTRLVDPDS
jgi:hypothetical protein